MRWLAPFLIAACGNDASNVPDAAPDAFACAPPAAGPAAERVPTTSGMIHGAMAGATWTYLGIPYAAPPVGALRFAPPAVPACSGADVEATAFGPMCPQLDDAGTFMGDEACLSLNVWAPAATTAARPVMVFIHGGANAAGTASDPLYTGRKLAEAGDVIVVTLDYRLGQLGFLDHTALAAESTASGNYGLLDQMAALRWVQTNIAAFGGDPANVLVFGESAGARDTCSLVAAPDAAGLFARALIESGSCRALPTRATAQQTGDMFAAAAGCTGDVPACLRALGTEALVRTLPPVASILASGAYQPTIDGTIQPAQPETRIAAGMHTHVPFIVGSNADETGAAAPAMFATDEAYQQALAAQFGPFADRVYAQYPPPSVTGSPYATRRAAFVRATTDARFVCPSRSIARDFTAGQSEPVYRYFFTYPASPYGAVHGIELAFLFGNFDAIVTANGPYQPNATDLAVSAAIQADWTSFARGGAPAGTPAWPRYDATDPARTFAATTGTTTGVRTADCDFWDSLL